MDNIFIFIYFYFYSFLIFGLGHQSHRPEVSGKNEDKETDQTSLRCYILYVI